MLIGVPKEVKTDEGRVALTPAGADALARRGHQVVVESGAGAKSGIPDGAFAAAGARIAPSAADVWAKADMIVKVKEPLASEWPMIRKGQIVFTYFHFAASRELVDAIVKSGAHAIAYETLEVHGTLPLLTPMSEVAGRMAVQEGAKWLEAPMGGAGILLGGVPGTPPANVLVLGGGTVGTQAARIAAGMGARVSILDINLDRLRYLSEIMPSNVTPLFSNQYVIREMLKTTHLLIGAVLVPGAKAPALVNREMLRGMMKGSVIVDVAVDQGGCVETCRPTTHSNPVFVEEGVIHYCVANMPGAVPQTSTYALTNATLPFAIRLAAGGLAAIRSDAALASAANVVNGRIVYKSVAEAFGQEHVPLEAALEAGATR
jgi:alanine dehydrogenase